MHTIRTIGANMVVFTYNRFTTSFILRSPRNTPECKRSVRYKQKECQLLPSKHSQHITEHVVLRIQVKIIPADLHHHLAIISSIPPNHLQTE